MIFDNRPFSAVAVSEAGLEATGAGRLGVMPFTTASWRGLAAIASVFCC